jgi:hypothetical protein
VRPVAARRAPGRPISPVGTVISGALLGNAKSLVNAPTAPHLEGGSAPAVQASAGADRSSSAALGFGITAVVALVAAGAVRELRDRRR